MLNKLNIERRRGEIEGNFRIWKNHLLFVNRLRCIFRFHIIIYASIFIRCIIFFVRYTYLLKEKDG